MTMLRFKYSMQKTMKNIIIGIYRGQSTYYYPERSKYRIRKNSEKVPLLTWVYLCIEYHHCNGCVKNEFNDKLFHMKMILRGDHILRTSKVFHYIPMYIYMYILLYFSIGNNRWIRLILSNNKLHIIINIVL